MATALEDGEENKSLVANCNLCKDTSRRPKLLPCQHSFCTQCLAQHRDTLDKEKPSDCPICHTEIKLDDDTVENLPDNYLYDIVKDAYGGVESSKMKCVSCNQVGKTTNATYKCLDCGDTLCQHCNEWHCRFTMSIHHVVVPLGDLKEGKFKEEFLTRKVLYCSLHSTDEKKILLSSYCKNCSCLVCVTCLQTEHQSHAVCELHAAKEEKQVRMQNDFTKLQRSDRDQQKRIIYIGNCIANTAQKWKDLETEVYDQAIEIYAIVDRIKDQKLAEMKYYYEQELQRLNDLLDEEKSIQSSLQATVALSYGFLEHSSDSDFLCNEKDVKTRMISSQRRETDSYQRNLLTIQKDNIETLSPVLKNVFGRMVPTKEIIRLGYSLRKGTKQFSQKVEIKHIYGIAFSAATEELVISGDSYQYSLLVLSSNGQSIRCIKCEKGSDAIHAKGHELFVTLYSRQTRQLVIIDANEKVRKRVKLPDDDQDAIDKLAMVVDETETVFLASSNTSRIYKINPGEDTLSTFLPKAYGPRLNGPLHVCMTPSDQLAVISPPNILLYSKDGELLSQHSGNKEESALINPCGVCCDEYGCVYVSDAKNCRIQVFQDMTFVGNIPIEKEAKQFEFIPLLLTPDRDLVYGYGNNLVKMSFWEWGEVTKH